MPLSKEQKSRLDQIAREGNVIDIGTSLQKVAGKNPDQAVRIGELAEAERLPYDVVERNLPEVDARHHRQQIDPEEIADNYPALSRYLADERNAAVSIDDVDNLKGIEDTIRDDPPFWSNIGRGAVSRTNQLLGNLLEFGGTLSEDFEAGMESMGIPNPGIKIGEDGISWSWDLSDDEVPSGLKVTGQYISEGEAHRVGYQPTFTWERLKGDITPTNLAGYVMEQGVKSLPDMAAVMATLPAYIASRTEEIAEQRARNDVRIEPDSGDLAASITTATAVALMERIGAKSVFDVGMTRTAKEVGQAAGEAFVREGVTEFAQEGLEYYGETVGTRQPVSHLEALDRAIAGAVAGGPFGGGIRGTTATTQAVSSRFMKDTMQTVQTLDEQVAIDEMVTLFQTNKTRERAQDRFRSFLRADGMKRTVFIPTAALNDLEAQGVELPTFLTGGLDPDADVEVSMERFATEIAPNPELMDALRPHVRLSADSMSAQELAEQTGEDIEDIINRAARERENRTQADEIYDQVKDQIVATGRQSEDTARYTAQIISSYAVTLAERQNITPMEAYQKMGFRVEGPGWTPEQGGQQVDQPSLRVIEGGKITDEEINELMQIATMAKAIERQGAARDDIQPWMEENMMPLVRKYAKPGQTVRQVIDEARETIQRERPDMPLDFMIFAQRGQFNETMPPNVWQQEDGFFTEDNASRLYAAEYADIVEQNPEDYPEHRNKTREQIEQEGREIFDSYYRGNPGDMVDVMRKHLPDDRLDLSPLLDQPIDGQGGGVLNQAQRNGIGLYSAVEKAVEDMNLPEWKKDDGRANGDVIWQKLNKMDGVKGEELEWMGLEGFLKPFADMGISAQTHEVMAFDDAWTVVRKVEGGLLGSEDMIADPATHPEMREAIKFDTEAQAQKFIKKKGAVTFTREQVLQFVRNNGVEVDETVATEDEAMETELDFMGEGIWDDPEAWSHIAEDYMYDYNNRQSDAIPGFDPFEWLYDGSNEQELDEFIDDHFDQQDAELAEELKQESDDNRLEAQLREYFERNNMDFEEAVFQQAREAAEEAAENRAREEYMENPMEIYRADLPQDDLYIFGNEDIGYEVRHGDWANAEAVVAGPEYSLGEAEIQAHNFAREQGMITDEDSEDVARWADHIDTEGPGTPNNYREVKLTLPDIQGSFYYEMHFPDRNIVAFMRNTDRAVTKEEMRQAQPQVEHYDDTEGWFIVDRRTGENIGINAYSTQEAAEAAMEAGDYRQTIDTRRLPRAISQTVEPREITDEQLSKDTIPDALWIAKDNVIWSRWKEETNPERVQQVEENWRNLSLEKRRNVWQQGEDARVEFLTSYGPKESTVDNMYYIDEFQSDWHQQGRQTGYMTGRDAGLLEARNVQSLIEELNTTFGEIFDQQPKDDDGYIDLQPPTSRDAFVEYSYEVLRNVDSPERNNRTGVGVLEILQQQPNFDELQQKVQQLQAAEAEVRTEREGVPDAPFKGNNWIALGLRRALIDAVESGYDKFGWADAQVVADRWSERYDTMYRTQYNDKMPSILKKELRKIGVNIEPQHLTYEGQPVQPPPKKEDVRITEEEAIGILEQGDEPVWVDAVDPETGERVGGLGGLTQLDTVTGEGVRSLERLREIHARDWSHTELVFYSGNWDSQRQTKGYWSVDLTPELKEAVMEKAFPLFQEGERIQGQLHILDNERVIKLTEASDLSTMLHESAHLFLEVEKQVAQETGQVDDIQRTILNWLEADSFDEIVANTKEGRAKHEKFARGFEAYLLEGKAPSNALRDAFAAFRRWLVRLYQSVTGLGVELNDDIRGAFDRLLATEAEIMEATTNPIYDQYFRSKEQAGMTDAEWKRYQKNVKRREDRAAESVNDQLMKEYRERRTKEWNEERAPLIEEEIERLSETPVYKVLSDAAEAPMDYNAVVEARGGEISNRLRGKLIGKALKREDTVDPGEYAEFYGFDSVNEMLDAIEQAPSLREAATEAAQNRMIEMHGDILNDGTLEAEVREALHNEDQAEVLLAELKALKRKNRPNAPDINRDHLKSKATRTIGKMTYRKIQPSKYYRAEKKAAQRAIREPDQAYDAKVQELANHYLYRAAVDRKKAMETQRRYIRNVETRDYNYTAVDRPTVQNMKVLARMYDLRSPQAQERDINRVLSWFDNQLQDPNQFVEPTILDPHLALAIEARRRNELTNFTLPKFDDLTADDLQGLYEQLRHMRFVGGQLAQVQNNEVMAERNHITEEVLQHGGRDVKDTERPQRKEKHWWQGAKYLTNSLLTIRNLTRTLDGTFTDTDREGATEKLIHRRIDEGNNRKMELNGEIHRMFETELRDLHRVGLSRNDERTITKENGMKQTMSTEEILMLVYNWGTESNREAVREGYNMTDNDAMAFMSELTPEQLQLANSMWKIKEHIWPQLSAAGVRTYGVAPEKLEAVPFMVNGVEMTGGHARLFYNSVELESREIQDEGEQYRTIMPSKAHSLYERVGSGGRPVLLDKNNFMREIEDSVHFIAFADAGTRIRRLLNAKDVQAAIQRKHGEGFHEAFMDKIDSLLRNKKEQQSNISRKVGGMYRHLRRAATMRHLVFSIRNIFQQASAVAPAIDEVGVPAYINALTRFAFDGGESLDFVRRNSPFMRNRSNFVNREATEFNNQVIMATGKAAWVWQEIQNYGFTPQAMMDSIISFPVWLARYEESVLNHGDHQRAVFDADTAVSESVGSGSDIHLGLAFGSQQGEFTRLLTMFGTFFNMYYNRMYRESQGFSKVYTPAGLKAMVLVPMVMAAMEAAIVMDLPTEFDDEDWPEWLLKRYMSFMSATVPVLRDVASFAFSGFSPKTVLAGAQEGPVRAFQEAMAYREGRQSGLKTASDVLKVGSTFVPIPGSGEVTRMLDYIDSYNSGNEGEWSTYQMLVEGPNRNK